jgi:hypothetical protein
MFAVLADNLHCTEQSFAQLLNTVTTALKDEDKSVQRGALEILTVLAGNTHCTEPVFAKLFAAVTAVQKDGNIWFQQNVLTTLVTFVGNPHLSTQQTAQIYSAVISGLKHESLQEDTKDNVIKLVEKCSPNQLSRYTALANTLMKVQGTDTMIQLNAISMLVAIQKRCQKELALCPVALETKAELEDEKVSSNSQTASGQKVLELGEQAKATAQNTLAGAVSIMGLLPRPKEQGSDNNPVNPASAVSAASAIQPVR